MAPEKLLVSVIGFVAKHFLYLAHSIPNPYGKCGVVGTLGRC